jgi:putative transposase
VRAHLAGRNDCLVKVAPLRAMIEDWQSLYDSVLPEEDLKEMYAHVRTGRPLGNELFIDGKYTGQV